MPVESNQKRTLEKSKFPNYQATILKSVKVLKVKGKLRCSFKFKKTKKIQKLNSTGDFKLTHFSIKIPLKPLVKCEEFEDKMIVTYQ